MLICSEPQFCGYQPLNHHHLDSASEECISMNFQWFSFSISFSFPDCLFALFLVIMTSVPMSNHALPRRILYTFQISEIKMHLVHSGESVEFGPGPSIYPSLNVIWFGPFFVVLHKLGM